MKEGKCGRETSFTRTTQSTAKPQFKTLQVLLKTMTTTGVRFGVPDGGGGGLCIGAISSQGFLVPPMEEMGKSTEELEVELEMESDRRPEGGGETQDVDVEIRQDGEAGDVEGGGQEQTTGGGFEQMEVEGAAASDWSRGGPGGVQKKVTAIDSVTAD